MDTLQRTVSYLFVLSLVLILVAYYAGTQGVLSTIFAGTNQLGNTFTGRNSSGAFAGYPGGGTTATTGH